MSHSPAARPPGTQRPLLPPKGLLLSLLAQVPLILLHWPLVPSWWQTAAGVVMVFVGVLLNLWADRLFRKGGVGVCPFSAVPQLVSDGPFRWTRNPMYLGFVMLPAGVVMLSGVWANVVFPLALLGWLHFRFVLPEEAFLEAQLGLVYKTYRACHPRWIGIPTAG